MKAVYMILLLGFASNAFAGYVCVSREITVRRWSGDSERCRSWLRNTVILNIGCAHEYHEKIGETTDLYYVKEGERKGIATFSGSSQSQDCQNQASRLSAADK